MTAADPRLLRVTVVYLRPGLAFERSLRLPSPATVGRAIEASGLRQEVPELADAELAVGIFGRLGELAEPLRDGDRVEVYRPLAMDPKSARRLRAAARRRQRRAG